jgi:hypothetical protein
MRVSYQRHSSKPWLVVRKKGTNGLVHTVPQERYRTKKRAEKEARMFNRACKGTDVHFSVRKEEWRKKRWHS